MKDRRGEVEKIRLRRLKASILLLQQIPIDYITFDILMHLLVIRFI